MWSLGKVLNTPEVMRVYIGYVLPLEFITSYFFSIEWVDFFIYNWF